MSPRESRDDQQVFDSGSSSSLTEEDKLPTAADLRRAAQQSRGRSSSGNRVSFGSIQVREYSRIVGDHPDVRVGPPLSLGWEFNEHPETSLDAYERSRPTRRRTFHMSSMTRKSLLRNVFQIDEKEIAAAEAEVQKIQRQREKTNKQGAVGEKVEGVFQSARRKLRRRFSTNSKIRDSYFSGFAAASGAMLPLGVSP